MNDTVRQLCAIMKDKYSTGISHYDDAFLEKAILYRITETQTRSAAEYLDLLGNSFPESVLLLNSLSNSFSEFFRNPLTFLVLEQNILPALFKNKTDKNIKEIRMWSAGCASGQEPYSLAILTKEFMKTHYTDYDVRIFATDKLENEIMNASKGIYAETALNNTRLLFVKKYFTLSGENYHINKTLKDAVDFSVFDLLDTDAISPPSSIYGDFDLIICSNVLFYYKKEIQHLIMSKLYRSLSFGGFLITGEAETGIVKTYRGFRQFMVPAAVFVKN